MPRASRAYDVYLVQWGFGEVTAQRVASHLDISIGTARRHLNNLVEDGTSRRTRINRSWVYTHNVN